MAIQLISTNLRKAVWQGHDKEARKNMASMIAGLAYFIAGTAGVHALAYPLGGLFHMMLGERNGRYASVCLRLYPPFLHREDGKSSNLPWVWGGRTPAQERMH